MGAEEGGQEEYTGAAAHYSQRLPQRGCGWKRKGTESAEGKQSGGGRALNRWLSRQQCRSSRGVHALLRCMARAAGPCNTQNGPILHGNPKPPSHMYSTVYSTPVIEARKIVHCETRLYEAL